MKSKPTLNADDVVKAKDSSNKDTTFSAKQKALEVTFAQIAKQYGKGAVMLLGQ